MPTELLLCPFYDDFSDKAGRHSLVDKNGVEIRTDFLGIPSAYFNGTSYLTTATDSRYIEDGSKGYLGFSLSELPNGDDFLLGATKIIRQYEPGNLEVVYPDNHFTIDAWIKMELGASRYYPICSSFSFGFDGLPLKIGWVLQVDTANGHLQLIHYRLGDCTGCKLESQLQVPFNTWTHVAVMVWATGNQAYPYAQAIFINGHPDNNSQCYFYDSFRLGNGYFPSVSLSSHRFAPFFVGLGPKSQFTDPGQSWLLDINPFCAYYFKGFISYLRICLDQRFSTPGEYPGTLQGFVPPLNYPSTSTTISTTTTGTTTVPVTWTSTSETTTSSTTASTISITTISYTTTTTWTTTTISYSTTTSLPPRTLVSVNGIASASHWYSDFTADKAFDLDPSTYWMCYPYETLPFWISYHWTSSSYIVDEYQLYFLDRGAPSEWSLQGSNNGTDWTTLDSQVNATDTGLLSYRVNNTTAYSWYRLLITGLRTLQYGTRIAEFSLYTNSRYYPSESDYHWVGYEFSSPQRVQRYCIKTSDQHRINSWKLQGSNDGIFWNDLDSQNSFDWVGWRCFEIESNNRYSQYIRLLVTQWALGSTPGIVELEFFRRP